MMKQKTNFKYKTLLKKYKKAADSANDILKELEE